MISAAARLSITLFCAMLGFAGGAAGGPGEPPRLAVAISIDQFRYDYLTRFRPHFVKGGFARLLEGGTNFENCTYPYANTKTAVGHATMLSGMLPQHHGIVGNDWVDRESWLKVVAVEDTEAPLLGLRPTTMKLPGGGLAPRSGRSPRRFLGTTVGDQLKLRYGKAAKVYGVSNKDRSAILMAGRQADGAFWDESGRIVTSTYYGDSLPGWVDAFNARDRVESFFGATWDRVIEKAAYDRIQGADDAPGEFDGDGLGRTFPRKITGGSSKPDAAFYSAFDNSPYASEFIAEFARLLIEQERLGLDEIPDLLCVSFSQPDTVGHNYGPDSHEIMDSVLRLDRVLAQLFAYLDGRVGANRWVVVITADHGVAPLPERIQTLNQEIPAGRINIRELDDTVKAALDAAHGPLADDGVWFIRDGYGYHLRPSALEAKGLAAGVIAQTIQLALVKLPWMAAVYTREELEHPPAGPDALWSLVRRSYFDARSPDVVFMPRPYFIEKSSFGTTHGAPWHYDRHVPQLWFGHGVGRAWRSEAVSMEDIAPTLAALLGVPRPPEAAGQQLF